MRIGNELSRNFRFPSKQGALTFRPKDWGLVSAITHGDPGLCCIRIHATSDGFVCLQGACAGSKHIAKERSIHEHQG
ncbi:hypothetical protein SAMN05216176_104358 [Nitratireductor indicus]|nr:hypothetical protein SAMN05216176_104358 [Nitratireductor indicus]